MGTILGKVVYRKHKHMFYTKYSNSVIYIYTPKLHNDLIQIVYKHVVNLLHFLKFC